MNKMALLHELIYLLRKNYPLCTSTFGNCSTDGCEKMGRGAGKCADCCEKEIAELTGLPQDAKQFHENTKQNAALICNFLERIEKGRINEEGEA